MRKLIFTSLILSLSASSLAANPEEYEREGKVFGQAKTTFLKETEESTERITHKPKGDILSLATVDYVSPHAILHFKYYQVALNAPRVKSFWITTNRNVLTHQSQLSALPEENRIASLPLELHQYAKSMKLLFFLEPNIECDPQCCAALTAALRIILSEFLPTIRQAGNCPFVNTVVIPDAKRSLAMFMSEPEHENMGPFKRTSVSAIEGMPDEFQVSYTRQ